MNIIVNKSDISFGKITITETDFSRIGITIIDNKYFAFEDICTHDGEPISEGSFTGNCIECPRHGAQFNIQTGEALCMPATENLKIYPLIETANTIEIILEEV
jgi:3-phenylpropionate/trans-cinnamate dioxygenase ferredoxin component